MCVFFLGHSSGGGGNFRFVLLSLPCFIVFQGGGGGSFDINLCGKVIKRTCMPLWAVVFLVIVIIVIVVLVTIIVAVSSYY